SLLLVDARLHAVVADAVPRSRRHRVVDANQRERGDEVALARRHVHLADALFERTAGERDSQRVLLVAIAVLLVEPLRAAVLLARVAVDAVVDLAAHLAGGGARVRQLESVAAPLVLGRSFDLVRLGPAERDERVEIEGVRG